MRSSEPTFEIWTVALTVASLNCSLTLPDGTAVSSKRPCESTDEDRFVPTTVTVSPVSAVPPLGPAPADIAEAAVPPLTMPTIVEPLDPDDDDDEGLVALPPPQAVTSRSAAQATTVSVPVEIRIYLLQVAWRAGAIGRKEANSVPSMMPH